LLAGGVAVAAGLLVATLGRGPGLDVRASAARAIAATYFFDARIVPAVPRLFPAAEVTGFVDGTDGRAHVHVYSTEGATIAETVLQPNGSVARWLARGNTTIVAASCAALPGGCGETFDPLGLYARALETPNVRVHAVRGGYELRLRSARVLQVVRIDGKRFLPRSIDWLQDGRRIATVRFNLLERQSKRVVPEAWAMAPHLGARVVQLLRNGRPVRVLRVRAARPTHGIRWLGPAYLGNRARVAEVVLTGGIATRVTYGRIVVWNYRSVVPPEVLSAQSLAAKVFPLRNGAIVHVYFARGAREVAVVSYGVENAAVVSMRGVNLDVVAAAQRLRRPESP
jgi:hypothetical protein